MDDQTRNNTHKEAMKTAKQIKARIKQLERLQSNTLNGQIQLKALYWVLDEQDGPVDFEELTS